MMSRYIVTQTVWYEVSADSTDQALDLVYNESDEAKVLDMEHTIEDARY